MQRDAYSFSPAEGLFQGLEKRIIIKRSVLSNRDTVPKSVSEIKNIAS